MHVGAHTHTSTHTCVINTNIKALRHLAHKGTCSNQHFLNRSDHRNPFLLQNSVPVVPWKRLLKTMGGTSEEVPSRSDTLWFWVSACCYGC